MHELRKDPLLNRWVAVLKDSKPVEYYLENTHALPDKDEAAPGKCLLCPGNELEASPEIFAIRKEGCSPNSPWETRVIPRINPIFQIEGELGRRGVGMYDKMNSIGANEIIIESPSHNTPPEELGLSQMVSVVKTYRHRISELEKDSRLRYTFLYKDYGRGSDSFFSHPVSQLVATPVIPASIKEELSGAKAYYYYKERCIFCDMLNDELRSGERVIMETANFVAFTTFAPRFSFEFRIVPKRHCCAFQDIRDDEIEDFGLVLMSTINKLKSLFRVPSYTYMLHTAPNRIPRKDHWHTLGDDFHWHVEVTPQLAVKNDFELGPEFYIITTSPEDAARYLSGA